MILTAAVDGERIPRNYCKSCSVKPPTVPERKARAWTRERVPAVRDALDPRFRLMVGLALVGACVIPPPTTRKQPVRGTSKFRTVKTCAESRDDGLHAPRHTFVSQLLGAGTSIVAGSNYVGHKDPSITLRIYAHMLPESDEQGRAAIDAWFEAES